MRRKHSQDWVYDGAYVATVESQTETGKTYYIRTKNGTMTCDCASYRFSHAPKSCKHLDAYHAGETMDAQRAVKPTVRQESVTVKARGETFTVRRARAISFEPLS